PRLPRRFDHRLALAIAQSPGHTGNLLHGLTSMFRLADPEVTRDWCRRCATVADFPTPDLRQTANLTKRLGTGEKLRSEYRRPTQRVFKLATPVGDVLYAIDDPLNQQFFSRLMPTGKPHEPGIVDYLCRTLTDRDLFVDIGAHTGYLSCIAGVAGATVVTMEFQRPLNQIIERNLSLNGIRRCQVLEMGASDRDGITMVPTLNAQFGAKLYDEQLDRQDHKLPADSPNVQMVPTMRLDTLFADMAEPPTVIKIDAEGFELKILQGAQRLISAGKTTFLVEYHVGLVGQFGGSESDLDALFPAGQWQVFRLQDHGLTDLDGASVKSQIETASQADGIHFVFRPR
ncbi:MAG: FkbM family methyltransferase, partial [Thalassobaculaceae bacterium]|nr:FkbM family methyltransferase [Thalassobaculaceae bacterium]